jgi:hypothetical protein
MFKCFIAAVAALASASAVAADDCPAFRPGQAYPWQTDEKLMPGDQWAWLFIDLDEQGKPKNCRVGEHKYQPETGFWMCRAMMAQGSFEPVMKDGLAVEGTVKRFMTVAGRQRQRAEEAARKQWFKDHPQERPSCYPR